MGFLFAAVTAITVFNRHTCHACHMEDTFSLQARVPLDAAVNVITVTSTDPALRGQPDDDDIHSDIRRGAPAGGGGGGGGGDGGGGGGGCGGGAYTALQARNRVLTIQ